MKITWIGETTYSPAFGELKAGKLLEIPDDTAKIWIGQGVAKPEYPLYPNEPHVRGRISGSIEQTKIKKTAKAGGGRK